MKKIFMIFLVLMVSNSGIAKDSEPCRIKDVFSGDDGMTHLKVELYEDKVIDVPLVYGLIYNKTVTCEQKRIFSHHFLIFNYITQEAGTSTIEWDKNYDVIFVDEKNDKIVPSFSTAISTKKFDRNDTVDAYMKAQNDFAITWILKEDKKEIYIQLKPFQKITLENPVKNYMFKNSSGIFSEID